MPGRWVRWLRNTAFTLIVFTVFLGGLELLLRATHLFGAYLAWTAPHPVYAWRFIPGRDFWFQEENDHPITGRINRAGWRDVDHPDPLPPGTRRVVVLGDSYVEALQVELDSTFFRLAASRLDAAGVPVDIVAMGQSGATQTEETLWLEREVPPYHPDAVVVVFCPANDVRDIAPSPQNTFRPYFLPGPDDSLVLDTGFANTSWYRSHARRNFVRRHSALMTLIVVRLEEALGARGERKKQAQERLAPVQTLATDTPDPDYVRRFALNKRLILAMADTCAARDCRFLLTSVDFCHRPEDEARFRAMDPSFDATWFDRQFAALADSAGFTYVPLQPAFREAYVAGGRSLVWGHWNYAGHRLVAGILAGALAAGWGTP